MIDLKEQFTNWLLKQNLSEKTKVGRKSTVFEYVRRINHLANNLYSLKNTSSNWDLLAKNITAVFAANDFSAMGALASIKEHNLIVPRDISIVGYDDIAFASLLEVPLTTVRQPIDAIGQKATEVINQLVNSEENIDSKIIILEPKLIVRSSTKAIS